MSRQQSPSIKINSAEMTRLRTVPARAKLVYIFSLRVRMDYRTGYAGITYRITYARICDDLDFLPLPGEQSERPTKAQVSRALQRLESVGLIKRESRRRRFIAHLPLSDYDEKQSLIERSAGSGEGSRSGRSTGRSNKADRPKQLDSNKLPINQPVMDSGGARPKQRPPTGRSIGRSPDPEDPVIHPGHTRARPRTRDGNRVAPPEADQGVCVQGDTGESKAVVQVWEHWKSVMDTQDSVLDSKRRHYIQRALDWGYTAEQLCAAITGCSRSPYHMGRNDKGQVFNGLSTILRDAEQIDRMRSSQTLPATSGERIRHGFPESVLKAHARPGEEYEHVAARLRARRDEVNRTTQEEK